MRSDAMFSQMIGRASASTFCTRGASASGGRRDNTRLIESRTSFAAASMSRFRLNSMLTEPDPLRLRDSTLSMPSMPLTASSRIWVTRVSTTAADAPG